MGKSGQETGSPTPKTPYHHGDLREALLRAAEAELTEKGMEGFTLRGCAKRAGVSHAAPKHHFRDANALLTELAAVGFGRFVQTMRARRDAAEDTPRARLVGVGLGYIDFAQENPALFRLMFSSFRPNFETASLMSEASDAFNVLVESVGELRGIDPRISKSAMRDVAAAWATAHGLADLLLSDRIRFMAEISDGAPERLYADIVSRSVPDRPVGSD
ncbi:TetR/AcrR family transcriptional regulator [Mesorhizobium australicum]|uniref:Transcriptional regulator, TetR family n=1 Tax=Mesorhizobium australicum TaxID=536018 RepID=A0A1X7PLI7_9HYPH|nr:TetR/AcrR family transcriptional regulator [Mesorhizobium australicum]SMH52363.1 transcriptional regulator, TetR family [Mesorhizobium australicum]